MMTDDMKDVFRKLLDEREVPKDIEDAFIKAKKRSDQCSGGPWEITQCAAWLDGYLRSKGNGAAQKKPGRVGRPPKKVLNVPDSFKYDHGDQVIVNNGWMRNMPGMVLGLEGDKVIVEFKKKDGGEYRQKLRPEVIKNAPILVDS